MSYQQVVPPDLSVTGRIGWCLEYAAKVFHAPSSAPASWNLDHIVRAFDAWQHAFQHEDRNLPNVSVPVWFSYWEDGINYGHVAVYVPGQGFFSSPITVNATHQVFPSIEAFEALGIGLTYVGWSEDILGEQVIKEGMLMVDQNMLNNLYLAVLNRAPDHPAADGWLGQPADVVLQALLDSPEYKALQASRQAEDAKVTDLQAKVDSLTTANLKLTDQLQAANTVDVQPAPATDPDSVTVTKDGFWQALLRFLGKG